MNIFAKFFVHISSILYFSIQSDCETIDKNKLLALELNCFSEMEEY